MARTGRWLGVAAVVCSAWTWSAAAGTPEDAAAALERGDIALAARLYEQALQEQPRLADSESFVNDMHRAQSRLAYETGSRLHAEGEYEPAIDQFLLAIAKDTGFKLAYAALEDAQRAALTQRFDFALRAADGGDLLAARDHLAQAIMHGGAASAEVATAAASIGPDPSQAFDAEALHKLAEARRLAEDRQWGLAGEQLTALVQAQPMLLPARAELARVIRFRELSESLTDDAAAMIQEKRLSPALEKLASAASVWPYNKRAAELLETVEASIKRAEARLAEAQQLYADGRWQRAYETVEQALDIDPSHGGARAFRSEARARYVQLLTEQAAEAIDAGDFATAHALIEQSNDIWRNNPDTRGALARYHGTLGNAAYEEHRYAVALLRYILADRYGAVPGRINELERHFIDQADASYLLSVAQSAPAIGVTSSGLESALAGRSFADYLRPTAEPAEARYTVSIHITDTDIDLRQRGSTNLVRTGGVGYTGTYTTSSVGYWEKYGHVRCRVVIHDNETDRVVRQWTARRWANYTDRQQYVVGQTWNTSYWTLPTDEAVEHRLAQDLAADLWPAIREEVALARARALRDQADELVDDKPETALELRVTGVVLAGQINGREATIELRKMAEALDGETVDPDAPPAE